MMALLESLTVWHEDDYKLTEILPFASLVIKLRKEGWKQKCKWSIETSPNALQVRRNIHFFVTEFKILWKYPQQIICEAKERRSRGETLFNNNQNIKTPASVICCNSRLCVSKSVNIVTSACLREKDQIYRLKVKPSIWIIQFWLTNGIRLRNSPYFCHFLRAVKRDSRAGRKPTK